MQCRVRRAYNSEERCTSLIEAAAMTSRVLSFDPPSACTMTTRSLGKYFRSPTRMACTTSPTVPALLWVGTPTSRSTSPTLISSRIKSSVSTLVSSRRNPCHTSSDVLPVLHDFISVAIETKRTGKDPWLTDMANHRCVERYSGQTFPPEYCPCSGAGRVPLPERNSKGYSPPVPSHS